MDFRTHLTATEGIKAEISRLQRLFALSRDDELLAQIVMLKQQLVREHCPPARFVWNEAKPILDKFKVYRKFL